MTSSTAIPIRPDAAPSMVDTVVAVYPTQTEAQQAVKALQQASFDMRKLSIVGRDYHTEQDILGYYNMGDRVRFWGKLGAFWDDTKNSVLAYETALKADKFLLIAHGTPSEVVRARELLATTAPERLDMHQPESGSHNAA